MKIFTAADSGTAHALTLRALGAVSSSLLFFSFFLLSFSFYFYFYLFFYFLFIALKSIANFLLLPLIFFISLFFLLISLSLPSGFYLHFKFLTALLYFYITYFPLLLSSPLLSSPLLSSPLLSSLLLSLSLLSSVSLPNAEGFLSFLGYSLLLLKFLLRTFFRCGTPHHLRLCPSC